MLVTKEVEVKWSGNNMSTYIEKGYEFTKFGDVFKVSTDDLMKGSNVRVDVKCDYCGEVVNKKNVQYWIAKDKSVIDKDACSKCKNKKLQETNIFLHGMTFTPQFKEARIKTSELRRMDYSAVQLAFEKKGYRLISTYYKNAQQKLQFICSKHENRGILEITYHDIQRDHGCKHCKFDKLSDLFSLDYEFVKNKFEERGYKLVNAEYVNSDQILKYICPEHIEKGFLKTTWRRFNQKKGCRYCAIDANKGKGNHNWKGGITDISSHLRDKLTDWKKDSMQKCNYKCVITGDSFNEIHHLINYSDILNKVFEKCNIEVKEKVGDYTENELFEITNLLIKLHYDYGLGVCLRKDVHKLFHKVYGVRDNTPQQFNEFQERIFNGEFVNDLNFPHTKSSEIHLQNQ